MKIRAYLFMMAAGILVPVVLFSGLALGMLHEAEHVAALRGLRETASNIGLLVDRELYSAEAALKVLAASPSLEAGDLQGFYRQALGGGKTLVSDVFMGPAVQRLITTVNLPVTLPDGRRYVLAMAFASEHFVELVRNANAPAEWRIGIIDRSATLSRET